MSGVPRRRAPAPSWLARAGGLLAAAPLLAALLAAPPLAAAPAPRPDPGLEPADVEEQYRAWATSKGVEGDAAELVCRSFAEAVDLCFSRPKGKGRAWWTRAEGKDAAALEAAGKGAAEEAVARLEPAKVEGFTRSYFVSARGDGRDHVPVLFPDALRARFGVDPVVAAPVRGVLVAWAPGDLDFDKVVGVGVRRMYDTLPDPVSPLLYRWDGKAWKVWGQARPAGEPAEPAAPAAPGAPAAPATPPATTPSTPSPAPSAPPPSSPG